MQRRGAGWAPDFVFPETSFRPMASGGATGGTRNAAALAEALAGGTRIPPFDDSAAADPHRQQLAGIVCLLLDRHALAHPLPMMSTRENPQPSWRRPHPVHEALWHFQIQGCFCRSVNNLQFQFYASTSLQPLKSSCDHAFLDENVWKPSPELPGFLWGRQGD